MLLFLLIVCYSAKISLRACKKIKTMNIELTPDVGVPMTPEVKLIDLHERAQAAAATADLLEEHGLDTTPNAEDHDVAAGLSSAYASNPELTSRAVNNNRAPKITPASMQLTRSILDEFSHAIVNNSVEIRRLVTNKLILESDNADPRVRIRALELLGKITDVGLFTEKTEVTITHQSTEDLRKKLREKFERIMRPEPETANEVEVDGEIIDVDAEMGLKPEQKPDVTPEISPKVVETTESAPETSTPVDETTQKELKRTETPLEPTIVYDDILNDWEES
jgi:hypothetical protein